MPAAPPGRQSGQKPAPHDVTEPPPTPQTAADLDPRVVELEVIEQLYHKMGDAQREEFKQALLNVAPGHSRRDVLIAAAQGEQRLTELEHLVAEYFSAPEAVAGQFEAQLIAWQIPEPDTSSNAPTPEELEIVGIAVKNEMRAVLSQMGYTENIIEGLPIFQRIENEISTDPLVYVKTTISMKPQDIIELAKREAERQAEVPAHPEPDTQAALGEIATAAMGLAATLGELDRQQIPLTRTEAETAIGGLRSITHQGNRAAWEIGLHAVGRGLLSQAALAKMLGVSTATVSRRIHEGLPDDEELSRTDVRRDQL